MHTVSQLCSACRSVRLSRRMTFNLLDSVSYYYPKPLAMVTPSATLTAPTNPLRPFATIIFQYSFFPTSPRGDGPALWRRVLSLHITVNVSESVVKIVYKSNDKGVQRQGRSTTMHSVISYFYIIAHFPRG